MEFKDRELQDLAALVSDERYRLAPGVEDGIFLFAWEFRDALKSAADMLDASEVQPYGQCMTWEAKAGGISRLLKLKRMVHTLPTGENIFHLCGLPVPKITSGVGYVPTVTELVTGPGSLQAKREWIMAGEGMRVRVTRENLGDRDLVINVPGPTSHDMGKPRRNPHNWGLEIEEGDDGRIALVRALETGAAHRFSWLSS